eukprot:324641_1
MAHFFTRFVRRLIRPRLNQHSLNHYRLHHHNRIPIEYTFSMLPVMLPIAEEDDEQGEDNNEEEKQKKKNVELNSESLDKWMTPQPAKRRRIDKEGDKKKKQNDKEEASP